MNAKNGEVREVNEQGVDIENWDENCMMIGLEGRRVPKVSEATMSPGNGTPEVKGTGYGLQPAETPWTGATQQDLELLSALLLKPLTLVTKDGIIKSPPVAEDSKFLRELGVWAAGVARWSKANRK